MPAITRHSYNKRSLRPRVVRPRYREYPPSELPSELYDDPYTTHVIPFPLFSLPLELIDQVIFLLPARTRFNLAYTCKRAYSMLLPILYRTFEITSPKSIYQLFGAENVSHLVHLDQHTRVFNLDLPLDGQSSSALRSAAHLYPLHRLLARPVTLLLGQKARWSLIDYPKYARCLRYFSREITVHIRWSGPSKIPHHWTRLFENIGVIAFGCDSTMIHLHWRMNELFHMPADAIQYLRLNRPSQLTIRLYVHPSPARQQRDTRGLTGKQAASESVKQLEEEERLVEHLGAMMAAFEMGRLLDRQKWEETEGLKALLGSKGRTFRCGPVSTTRTPTQSKSALATSNLLDKTPPPSCARPRLEAILMTTSSDRAGDIDRAVCCRGSSVSKHLPSTRTMPPQLVSNGGISRSKEYVSREVSRVHMQDDSHLGQPDDGDFIVRSGHEAGSCGICGF